MSASRSFADLIARMDPGIYRNMKTAVELGRWPDGERLSEEQRQWCLQAIIAWEHQHLPEHERTGYIDRSGLQESGCHAPAAESEPITWREDGS